MPHSPSSKEISPNTQPQPPLLQLEADSPRYYSVTGRRADPHLAAMSFQVPVKDNEVSPNLPVSKINTPSALSRRAFRPYNIWTLVPSLVPPGSCSQPPRHHRLGFAGLHPPWGCSSPEELHLPVAAPEIADLGVFGAPPAPGADGVRCPVTEACWVRRDRRRILTGTLPPRARFHVLLVPRLEKKKKKGNINTRGPCCAAPRGSPSGAGSVFSPFYRRGN